MWSAPDNPDPAAIRGDMRAAFAAGQYADALAMQVWFHENALLHRRSFGGVRLSYALCDWADLAVQYPPALARLIATRDAAAAEPAAERFGSSAMHDLTAINELLGAEAETVAVFDRIEREQPDFAATAFLFCRTALLKLRLYDRVLRYLQPEADLDRLIHLHDLQCELVRSGRCADDLLSYAEDSYRDGCATLVALLVIGKRNREADDIARRARAYRSDDRIDAALTAALNGVVPEQRGTRVHAELQRLAATRPQ